MNDWRSNQSGKARHVMRTRVLRQPIVFLRLRCSILILLIKSVRCSIVRCSIIRCSIIRCSIPPLYSASVNVHFIYTFNFVPPPQHTHTHTHIRQCRYPTPSQPMQQQGIRRCHYPFTYTLARKTNDRYVTQKIQKWQHQEQVENTYLGNKI